MKEKKSKNRKNLQIPVTVICTFLVSLTFIINNNYYEPTAEQMKNLKDAWAVLAWQLGKSFAQASTFDTFAFVLIFAGLWFLYPKVKRKNLPWMIPTGFIYALMLLLCKSYYTYNSWQMVFSHYAAFGLSLLKAAGMTVVFVYLFSLIQEISLPAEEEYSFSTFSVLKRMLLILLLWLPYMIIMIPGCMNPDTTDQVAQVLGNAKYCWTAQRINLISEEVLLNNHHPVFHTMLIGVFVKLGEMIGSYLIAFTIFGFLQSTLLAFTLSFQCEVIKCRTSSRKFLLICTLFCALNPIFPLYGVTLMKDIPFAIVLWWCMWKFYRMMSDPKAISISDCIVLGILLVFWMLTRNNSFYILLVLFPFTLIFLRKHKAALLKTGVTMLLALLFFKAGIQGAIFSAMQISNSSSQEMYSVPFVQTARVLAEHPDEITEEEKDILLHIFTTKKGDVQEIAERYLSQPAKADRVKERFSKETGPEYMGQYRRLWLKWLTKYPSDYIQAFLNLNYPWFTVDSPHDNRFYNGITDETIAEMLPDMKNLFVMPRRILGAFIIWLAKIPVLGWLVEFSFYTWAVLHLLIVMIIKKRKAEILTMGMVLVNYMICFVGPVAYMRYAFPTLCVLPMLLLFALAGDRSTAAGAENEIETGEA